MEEPPPQAELTEYPSKFDQGVVPTGFEEPPVLSTSTTAELDEGMGSAGSAGSSEGEDPADPPPPPSGMYHPCVSNEECDLLEVDGCLLILDADQQIEDGYCTILCGDVIECGEGPEVAGTQVCDALVDAKVCAILCMTDLDCPWGMGCKNIFNSGSYCI